MAARDRSHLTARIVPLESVEAADARVGGTASERLTILAELSRRMDLTRRPRPTYSRKSISGPTHDAPRSVAQRVNEDYRDILMARVQEEA